MYAVDLLLRTLDNSNLDYSCEDGAKFTTALFSFILEKNAFARQMLIISIYVCACYIKQTRSPRPGVVTMSQPAAIA